MSEKPVFTKDKIRKCDYAGGMFTNFDIDPTLISAADSETASFLEEYTAVKASIDKLRSKYADFFAEVK